MDKRRELPPKRYAEVGRLAFRVEGPEWIAYWAPSQDSMNGAIRIGSIAMSVVAHPAFKSDFMLLMTKAFALLAAEATGATVLWGEPHTAPEHERSGSA